MARTRNFLRGFGKKIHAQASMLESGKKSYKSFEGAASAKRGGWHTNSAGEFTDAPRRIKASSENDEHHYTFTDTGKHPEGACNYENCQN